MEEIEGDMNTCKLVHACILALLLLAFVSCGDGDTAEFDVTDEEGMQTVAILETTQGPIEIGFFPDKAPEHVRNFLNLCGTGYYDGTYFHRVAPGFMIQGGDPNTRDEDPSNDGQGGSSYRGPNTTLEPEFNDIRHVRGVVSMARSAAPDSAGSQFFIMVEDAPQLDGSYTVFGHVLNGMGAVDEIVEQPGTPIPGAGGVRPAEPQYIERCHVENREASSERP